jgi:hypothetical protein
MFRRPQGFMNRSLRAKRLPRERSREGKIEKIYVVRATWSTSLLRAIVFVGHEPAIPPQDGVRRDDTSDGRLAAAAEVFPFHGRSALLVVGEAQSSGCLRRRRPVLLEAGSQ